MPNPPSASSGESARVQLYADVEHVERFSELHKELGMSQREASSRLFAWFNRQSPLIRQQIIQPILSEIAPDIARIILERMAEQDRLKKQSRDTTKDSDRDPTDESPHEQNSVTVYGENR